MKIDTCTTVGAVIAASLFAAVYVLAHSLFPDRPASLAPLRVGLAVIPAAFCASLVLIVTREVRNALVKKDS